MEGYSSSTLNKSYAKQFASITEDAQPVLLSIKMKNETGKYYFSLDQPEYSNYPNEREILLQAGLIFKFEKIEDDVDMKIIYLSTSESMIKKHNRRKSLIFYVPFACFYLMQIMTIFLILD